LLRHFPDFLDGAHEANERPSWALGALAAGASIAVTIGLATPARAALFGTDWTSVPLSASVTQGIAE
jgi:hypothetical protein